MTGTARPRAGHRLRAAAVLAAAALLAGGCTADPAQPPATPVSASATEPADGSQAAVALETGTSDLERIVAQVLSRHLTHRGISVHLAEPSGRPWADAGGSRAAVVDTLAMAARLHPEELAGPVPTPTPSATATGSPTASPSPEAGAGASPTPTESFTPDPVPSGTPAPDAAGTRSLVVDELPEQTEFLAGSPGTLRLQAVTTTAVAGLGDLEELTDLNGRCDDLVFTPQRWGELEAERLEVLAGCTPQEWVAAGDRGPALDVVTGRAEVALLYGTDPAIRDHSLAPLSDPDRILPEGRLTVVADPESLPEGAHAAISEVVERLDGDQMAALQRLIDGPDPLSPEEAAQYWLVGQGLEVRPDDWF